MNELFVDYIIFAKKERMESLKQRRTIRKYQQKDISADLLNDLLETSFRASTVGNMQVYSVIVTRDAERKAKLAPAHFNQPMVRTAPVVLTFCIDLRRFSKWCEQRKAEPGYNNFEWFVTSLRIGARFGISYTKVTLFCKSAPHAPFFCPQQAQRFYPAGAAVLPVGSCLPVICAVSWRGSPVCPCRLRATIR